MVGIAALVGGGTYRMAAAPTDTPAPLTFGTIQAANPPAARFIAPAVSVSSLTLPNRDSIGVVVRWTARCVRGVCPQTYNMKVVLKNDLGYTTYHEGTYTGTRVVVPFAKPICPRVDTALMQVASDARGDVENSVHTTGTFALRCRVQTAAERILQLALADSFPDEGYRMLASSTKHVKMDSTQRAALLQGQLRAARTATDSAAARVRWAQIDNMADTLVVPQKADTIEARVGFMTYVCMLARNRYTGAVVVMGGSTTACESVRAAYASERRS